MSQSVLIWLWLVVTGIGVVLTTFIVIQAKQDVDFVRKAGINHLVPMRVEFDLRVETRRLIIKVGAFSIGVWALFREPPTATCQTRSGSFIGLLLIAIFAVMDWNSISELIVRRKMLREVGRK